jgi:hypothetical protein
MKRKAMIGRMLLLATGLSAFIAMKAEAQDETGRRTVPRDSIIERSDRRLPPDSTLSRLFPTFVKKPFQPNPTKAVLLSLIPGVGQIYNRKYWKLPIVYGAFMGCMYAITWNGRNYQDYWNAYKAIMHDSQAYTALVNASGGGEVNYKFNTAWTDLVTTTDYKSVVNNTQYQNLFKSRKDFFRRNRDLSIIIAAGVYLLSLADAYVDAELFNFDISPDLSMRVEPTASPATRFAPSHLGLNWSITF